MYYKARAISPRRLIATLCFSLATALFFAQMPSTSYAAPGDLDPTFSGDGKFTDGVGYPTKVAIQPDGKILVLIFGTGLARYNSNGTTDTSFGGGTGSVTVNCGIRGFAVQSDDKIVVGGIGGTELAPAFCVARLNSDGSPDLSFGGGTGLVLTALTCGDFNNNFEAAFTVQPDGKMVGAVKWEYCNGHLLRYGTNGSLDHSFGSSGIATTAADQSAYFGTIAIQPDGKIVVVGPGWTLRRFETNGSPDMGFNADFQPLQYVFSVAIQPDNKIVACGLVSGDFGVVRYNGDGSPDTSFGGDGSVTTSIGSANDGATSVAVQAEGKLVAAGYSNNGLSSDFALVRYNVDGSLDSTFGGGDGITTTDFDNSNDQAMDLTLDATGRAVVVGTSYLNSISRIALARFLLAPVAVTITVTNTNDSGAGSLRQAIADAAPGDTINFGGSISGSTITLTSGELVIDKDLTIQGPGAHLLSISGNNASRVFNIYQATATLDGITIRDGTAGEGLIGGGINNSQTGRLTVSNCAVSNNAATYGGGIANGGALTFTNSASSNNIASYLGGGIHNAGTLTVTNSAVAGNTVIDGGSVLGGAGIYNSAAILTVVRSTVSGNNGSGIGNEGYCDDSFECYNATAIITNSTVSTNTGVGITNSAICFFGKCPTVLANLVNSTIYGNAGGGIGALGVPGSTLLNNTIVAGNPGYDIGVNIGSAGAGHSLIGDAASSGGIVNGVNGNIVGINPLLGPLQNNGGPTLTHALLRGSPAINVGNNCVLILNGCVNGNPALPNDQRGIARKGNVDIGSFELGSRPRFDFDGDGRADVSVFRPSDRVWYFNRSTDGFTAVQFGLSTDKITPADFDGDGKADIAIYRDGMWYWLNSSTNSFGAFQFGLAGDIPQPADYTGDGRDELAVYRDGTWWMFDLTNGEASGIQFGLASDKPVPADYDGDGSVDQAVYRGSGEWYLNQSAQGFSSVYFGLATDKPVPADYDGDGKTEIAVFRPSEGNWYRRRSFDGQVSATNWGLAADIPVPADYDGDGHTDIAVYRSGIWYVLNSSNGSITYRHFGLSSDIPVASANAP